MAAIGSLVPRLPRSGTRTLKLCRRSFESRLSVPDSVSQLWRKTGGPFRILSRSFGEKSALQFFSKAAIQNPERRAWVRGYCRRGELVSCPPRTRLPARNGLVNEVEFLGLIPQNGNFTCSRPKKHFSSY